MQRSVKNGGKLPLAKPQRKLTLSADCEFAVSSISHARRMAGKRAATAAIRGRIEWPVWAVRNMSARPGGGLCKARFLRIAAVGMADGESRLSTLRVDGPTHPVRDIKGYFGLELQNF